MRIGLISDTHGHFDPAIPALFEGVDHILHAGDIGSWKVLSELERIAPVTAILGNNDFGIAGLERLSETEGIQLHGKLWLIQHIVDPARPDERLQRRIDREAADFVVFGHTHQPFERRFGRTMYVNPGYAGRPRFNAGRSVMIALMRDGIPFFETLALP